MLLLETAIGGYAQIGHFGEALKYEVETPYNSRLHYPCKVWNLQCVFQGRFLHRLTLKTLMGSDIRVQNALLTMYSRCGDIKSTRSVFSSSPNHNLCSWNCMISVFTQNKDALVDMYYKCGRLDIAFRIFQNSPDENAKYDYFPCISLVSELVLLSSEELYHYKNLVQTSAQTVACSETDRAALLSFKARILKDTTDILSSWTGKDCCGGDWEGIECNPTTGRVIGLQLQRPPERDNGLYMKGTLSPSLASLQFLEVLIISGMKQISGTIPESFSKLIHLTQLVFEDNTLQGSIPSSLGQLPLLKTLSLSGNNLKGQIPPSLGSLRNLLQLTLAKNSLTSQIPPTLKNLHSLQYFDLSYNLLSGLIPDYIGQFQNLTFLDFSNNQLSGHIPTSLCNLPNLLDISLSHNQLTGIIPDQIGSLKAISSLSLSSNNLTGQIPESISRLKKLWYLNLSRNGLSDPLPGALAVGIPSLLSIDLSYNKLHLSTVPDWIRKRGLADVHFAGCNLGGTLPSFTNPASLNSIDLSDNFLTGGISNFFTNMSNLQKIKLGNNLLWFDISEIALPDGISSLDLHSNQLYGPFARLLQNHKSKFLEIVDISRNQITGGIPEFSESSRLKYLNLASNKITGQIPSSISNLIELERLDISRNQITGTIPTSLGQLLRLQWLDLSINALTGKIPDSLLALGSIRHVNFRANRLCGQIPQGRPFNIFPVAAYAHNQCLCGKPMPPCKGKEA
ncbi:hypothetical protein HHK36_000554 [Tetracentron sinense]|uniref:Leucine-rich repeat-containing N-terminal plant-type domain-containing protein n=1 Tax=Tetracentron sinense TaxID=13715 RepID=A0A834ZW23_TETSI|nr:hypothetical protein HHK36_000554 [Tetracentron sinense]